MKTVSNRILSLFLALAMLCGVLVLPASAATAEAQKAANSLYELGLFQGVGTLANGKPDFDLDGTATRAQAAVMLVRLLGAEQEAKSRHYKHPFTDVSAWANDYVGYAKVKNITSGVSATKFGSDSRITSSQFVTLVLRALGYSNVDYRNPAPTANAAGLACPATTTFTRGDMAVVCLSALSCRISGTAQTLRQQLESKGVIKNPAAGSKTDLQAFYQSVCEKYQYFNATMAVEGEFLANYYPGLSGIATNQQVIYMTMMSAAVCEIALVEVKNASDVQKVKDSFQARIDAQVGTDDAPGGAWYPASIEGWKTGSRIVSNGNFVMMIVFPDGADQIVSDFNKLF